MDSHSINAWDPLKRKSVRIDYRAVVWKNQVWNKPISVNAYILVVITSDYCNSGYFPWPFHVAVEIFCT